MTFKEALKILKIEDYGERIFNSNSKGELSHLYVYGQYAQMTKEAGQEDGTMFRKLFVSAVEKAEKTWERPESVFQHLHTIISEELKLKEDEIENRTADIDEDMPGEF